MIKKNNTLEREYNSIYFNCRCYLPQVIYNIRNKQNSVYSKDQRVTAETDDDDQPIKYSGSKAAYMRINEYRDPYGDQVPWYQPHCVSLSLTIFLIYFCILREENDIDLLLNRELGDHFLQSEDAVAKKNADNLISK